MNSDTNFKYNILKKVIAKPTEAGINDLNDDNESSDGNESYSPLSSLHDFESINPSGLLISMVSASENTFSSHTFKNEKKIKYNWYDKKILVVEDDDANFMFLEFVLKKTDVKILRAIDGLEAVKLARQFDDINIILMDIQLPLMDGYDATAEIRGFNKEIPIIAQTAYAQQTNRDRCFECGCNEFVTKPIDKVELLELINKYFLSGNH